jgi:hypothetical protein
MARRAETCSVSNKILFFNLSKPTGYEMHQQVEFFLTILRSAKTVFMCFVFVWEQTAICAIYIKTN